MPKFGVWVQAWIEAREIEASSEAAAKKMATDIIKAGYDKRYWGFEIHTYSVNGEDF